MAKQTITATIRAIIKTDGKKCDQSCVWQTWGDCTLFSNSLGMARKLRERDGYVFRCAQCLAAETEPRNG